MYSYAYLLHGVKLDSLHYIEHRAQSISAQYFVHTKQKTIIFLSKGCILCYPFETLQMTEKCPHLTWMGSIRQQ